MASLVQKSHTSQAIYGVIGDPKHELAENAWFRPFPWGVAENAQAPTEVLWSGPSLRWTRGEPGSGLRRFFLVCGAGSDNIVALR